MQACWNANPDERPSFTKLLIAMEDKISESGVSYDFIIAYRFSTTRMVFPANFSKFKKIFLSQMYTEFTANPQRNVEYDDFPTL